MSQKTAPNKREVPPLGKHFSRFYLFRYNHYTIAPENKIAAVFMKNSKCDGGAANESARKFEEAVYSSFA